MTGISMRRTSAAIACLIGMAAAAEARPYAPEMSCRSLAAAVQSEGALVISTGPSTYDRFVSGGRYCERTQETEAAWIPAADEPQCFVGYTCRELQRGER
ncbi:MAG TPA: hypothetical protein VGC51_08260 [Hansschlegelia sp.]